MRPQDWHIVTVAAHHIRFILDALSQRTLVQRPALSNDSICQFNRRLVQDNKIDRASIERFREAMRQFTAQTRNWRIPVQRHCQIDVAERTNLPASMRSEEIDQPHLWMRGCNRRDTLLKNLQIETGHQRLVGIEDVYDDCTTTIP